MEATKPLTFFHRLKNHLQRCYCACYYHWARCFHKFYPCKLVAEDNHPEMGRLVLCRFLGKGVIEPIPINYLTENLSLLAKFSPHDAMKIGALAMGERLCAGEDIALCEKHEQLVQTWLGGCNEAQYKDDTHG